MAMTIYQFPAQKKLISEKTEQWGKDCLDAGLTISYSDTSKIRKSKASKQLNFDLVNGIIDESDIELAFNPMGIRGVNFPAKIQNYPIEITKFNVLKGEEGRRRFDCRIRAINEDSISQKEFMIKDQIYNLIASEITNAGYDEEKAMRRLKQLQHYHNYEYKDYGEEMGQSIIDYFWYSQKMKDIFSDGFWDVLLGAEEIYSVDIIHGEPVVSKQSILNVSTFGGSDNHKIEDNDIIIVDGFVPIGAIIDEFWDVLSSEEIDLLENGSRENRYGGNIVLAGPMDKDGRTLDYSHSQLITLGGTDLNNYGGWFDTDGNVRKTRVIWRSKRKIGKLKYYDQQGNEQVTIIDENFPVDQFKDLGWEVDWRWINEWWQGYKIGNNIYKKIEPLPRVGTKISNPSICLPPIVGTIYNIGNGTGVSLMDRIKPYKYLYNVYMRRTELASARNKGVFAELDLAEIPDGWDEELVMMYAEANGYMIKDSFKEGKKGQSMGKLIGTIKQRGTEAINLDSSNVILANLKLAQYVKAELGEISGITPQREGQIDNRETYGGVERSVTQSSHITEEWFRLHDNTKVRVIELLIETAKEAWRNNTGSNNKKLQYVDDGTISHILSIDGRRFAETEYGFFVSDGSKDTELIQTIKQLTMTFIQNDKVRVKDLFSIFRETSVSSMERKLEDSEEQAFQREDDARKQQLESNEKMQQSLERIKQMEMEQEDRHEANRLEADIYIKELEIEAMLTAAELKVNPGDTEKADKMQLELEKFRETNKLKREEMSRKNSEYKDKIKSTEKLASATLRTQEKIARQRKTVSTIKK